MRKTFLAATLIVIAGAAAAQQPPASAPPDPLQIEVNEVKRRIAQYTENLKAMQAAEAATKGLKATDEATLANLQTQLPKPKSSGK